MDDTLKAIADFSHTLSYADLSASSVHETKRRVIDTLGCALGAFDAEPSRIARAMAERVTGRPPARIMGSLEESSPELAAFANGVMMRYLDLNDATGTGGGHPSDMLSALLAASEAGKRTDGRTFLTAVAAAYEIYLGFFAALQIRDRGWDHVVYTVLGATAGVAKIMHLDHAATAHAMSLALTPNMALGVARRGELSMWKGCAGGNASRNAIFAAQLAAEGMTGPAEVFDGANGVKNAVGAFAWPPFAGRDGEFRITRTQIKMHPCIYPGQSPVEAALAVRNEVENTDDIEAVVVRTYFNAWWEAASEPEMWSPNTRETADHSIPYLVSAALLDGNIGPDSFTTPRMFDHRLRSLIGKIEVIHDTDLDKLTPALDPCRIEIRLENGTRRFGSVDYPKGHIRNPPTDAEIEDKLIRLNDGRMSERDVRRLLEICWTLEKVDDMRTLVTATAVRGATR